MSGIRCGEVRDIIEIFALDVFFEFEVEFNKQENEAIDFVCNDAFDALFHDGSRGGKC